MGRIIIRASANEPAVYGEYSSIVDNFTYVNASRKQMLSYLLSDYVKGTDRRKYEREQAIKRLDRADKTGTSSMIGDGQWDDDLIIMNNEPHDDGMLPRDKVGQFMARLEQGQSTDDLITPFEKEEVG